MNTLHTVVWVLVGGMIAGVGCSKTTVTAPQFAPAAAAKQAMAEFDANQDGTLDAAELDKCPGLKAAKSTIDADGNGSLSEAEIAARIAKYVDQKVAVLPVKVQVLMDDKPLGEATVALVPEPFLAAFIKPAIAVTDKYGFGMLSCEEFASKGVGGVNPGIYRVEISATSNTKPLSAKYNTETVLGLEVALDRPDLERGLSLKLSSR